MRVVVVVLTWIIILFGVYMRIVRFEIAISNDQNSNKKLILVFFFFLPFYLQHQFQLQF